MPHGSRGVRGSHLGPFWVAPVELGLDQAADLDAVDLQVPDVPEDLDILQLHPGHPDAGHLHDVHPGAVRPDFCAAASTAACLTRSA
jgi:hypothetical protein